MADRIEKVKFDGSKVRIEYSTERKDGRFDEQVLASFDTPAKEFNDALQALKADVCTICELPSDYANVMRVSSVSITWTNDVMGAVITAVRPVKTANSPVVLNTPHLPATDYAPGGSGPTLEGATVERLERLIAECHRYILGDRAPHALPLATGAGADEPLSPGFLRAAKGLVSGIDGDRISSLTLSAGGKTVTIDKAAAERITANVDAALRS